MDRLQFIEIVGAAAAKLRRTGSPIFPSIRIAQSLLETGGKIPKWNNVVGFKVGSGKPNEFWDGSRVNTNTWEVYDGVQHNGVSADWRSYKTVEDCFRDQDRLFRTDRYKDVATATTPEDQAVALYRCGYATDPDYYKKIIAITKDLKQYDANPDEEVTKEDEDKLELSKYQRDRLILGLRSLLKRKVINDATWVEKAENGTLTLSELAWLNFELTVNK